MNSFFPAHTVDRNLNKHFSSISQFRPSHKQTHNRRLRHLVLLYFLCKPTKSEHIAHNNVVAGNCFAVLLHKKLFGTEELGRKSVGS